jgi:hypothetical protein
MFGAYLLADPSYELGDGGFGNEPTQYPQNYLNSGNDIVSMCKDSGSGCRG